MSILFLAWVANSFAFDEADVIELEIYRERTPKLQQRVFALENQINLSNFCQQLTAENDPACEYRARWWRHQVEILNFDLKVLEWQIFASNCILVIISLLLVSGILAGFYQLWIAAKIASFSAASTELELSSSRVRVQTSVIGIAMIIISGIFLIFFLREVYRIEPINIYGLLSVPSTTTDNT